MTSTSFHNKVFFASVLLTLLLGFCRLSSANEPERSQFNYVTDYQLISVVHKQDKLFTVTYSLAKDYDLNFEPEIHADSKGVSGDSYTIPTQYLTQGTHSVDVNFPAETGDVNLLVYWQPAGQMKEGYLHELEISSTQQVTIVHSEQIIGPGVSVSSHAEPRCQTCGEQVGSTAVTCVIAEQYPRFELPTGNAQHPSSCGQCVSGSVAPETSSEIRPVVSVRPNDAVLGGSLGAGVFLPYFDSNAYLVQNEGLGAMARVYVADWGAAFTFSDGHDGDPIDNILKGEFPVFKEVKIDGPELICTHHDGRKMIFELYDLPSSDDDNLDQDGRLKKVIDRNGHGLTFTYSSSYPTYDTITDRYNNVLTATWGASVGGRKAITSLTVNGSAYTITYADNFINEITGHSYKWTCGLTAETDAVKMTITSPESGQRDYRFLPDFLAVNLSILGQPSGFLKSIYDSNGDNIFSVFPSPFPTTGGPEFRIMYGDNRKLSLYKVGEYEMFYSSWDLPGGVATEWNSFTNTIAETCFARNDFNAAPGGGGPGGGPGGGGSGSSIYEWMIGAPPVVYDMYGQTIFQEYDSDYYVTKRTYYDSANGPTEMWARNDFKQVTQYTDQVGRVTTNEYDGAGNLTKQTVGTGTSQSILKWDYNSLGQVTHAYDGLYNATATDLHVTEYVYGTNNLLVTKREAADDAGGSRPETTYTYDGFNRLKTMSDPIGRTVTYDFDIIGRLIETEYNDSSTETYTYNADGRLEKSKNRTGSVTYYEYDSNGRQFQTTQNYEHDDGAGNVTATNPVNRSITTITYLPGSRIAQYRKTNGKRTALYYDYRDRLIDQRVYPYAGKTLRTEHEYRCNRLFSTRDPYGRMTYMAFSESDPTEMIRTIRCNRPGYTFADTNAVMNATRNLAPNAIYLIADAIKNEAGDIVEMIDGKGISTTYEYDDQGRRTKTTAANLAITESIYDAAGNVIEHRTPRYFDAADTNAYNKKRTTSTYTGRNLLKSQTEAPGESIAGTTSYTYYLDGRLKERTDQRGYLWTSYWHSCCGRALGSKDPLGHGSISNTDYEGRVTHTAVVKDFDTIVGNPHDPINTSTYNESTTRYDGLGRMIASTTWLGKRGLIDANAPPIAGLDGFAKTTGLTNQVIYDNNLNDGQGLEVGMSIPQLGGGSYSLSLEDCLDILDTKLGITFNTIASGSATVAINGEEEIRVSIADGAGRNILQAQLAPHDASTPFEIITYQIVDHDEFHFIQGFGNAIASKTIDALDNSTFSALDGSGRALQSVDQSGAVTNFEYDANNNMLSSIDANGVGVTEIEYDDLNRTIRTVDSYGDETSQTYNLEGQVTQNTDAKSKSSTIEYDARGRKIKLVDRLSGQTLYSYDVAGNLTSIADAEGGVTSYTYTERGRREYEVFPDHQMGSYGNPLFGKRLTVYDPAGRVFVLKDQSGQRKILRYDMANRVLRRDYYDASGPRIDQAVFTFDRENRVTSAYSERYSNTVTNTYDGAGRLKSETLDVNGVSYTVTSEYNERSQLSKLTYPDGSTVERTYNSRALLETVKWNGSVIDTRTYDTGGRLSTITHGNGATTNRSYRDDSNGKDNLLASIATTQPGGATDLVGTYTYSYDANKNKLSETITGAGAMNNYGFNATGTTYDDDDRLTAWSRADGSNTQAWNLSLVHDWNSFTKNGTVQNRTHNAVHEVTDIDGTALQHDIKGNLTHNSNGHVYTWDRDNMLTSVDTDGDGTAEFEAKYDALGRRVEFGPAGNLKTYVYSGQQVVGIYNNQAAPGSPTTKYVFGSYVDEPILVETEISGSSVQSYYHRNQQYSITALTDSTGNVVERYRYDAYGNTSILEPSGTTPRTASSHGNVFAYSGRYYHSAIDLYFFRARYFDSKLGQFISRDPLGFVDGTNLYRAYFVPGRLDPSGLSNFYLKLNWYDYDYWNQDDRLGSGSWDASFSANIWCDKEGNAVGSSLYHSSAGQTNFIWGSSYIVSDIMGWPERIQGSDRKAYQVHVFSSVSTNGGYASWAMSGLGGAAGWFIGTVGGSPSGPGAIALGLAGAGIGAAAGAFLTDWIVGGGSAWEARFTFECKKCCNKEKGTTEYFVDIKKREVAYQLGEYYPRGRYLHPVFIKELGCQQDGHFDQFNYLNHRYTGTTF